MRLVSGNLGLQELMAGNQRFVLGKLTHPNQTAEHRRALAFGQQPFAVIVGCSDSRVPPEILFDQGLGDLFVVRVAGNVVDDVVLGSIEYAVEHLHVPLIVVLGHGGCGVVTAALNAEDAPGHIGSVAAAIQPAVQMAIGRAGDALDNAIRANVELSVSRLQTESLVLAELVQAGRLKTVGAYYDLQSGAVSLIA